MSVVVEFTVSADSFALGRVLSVGPPVSAELERLVPTGDDFLPFFWAETDRRDAFESSVRDHPLVAGLERLATEDGVALYRARWDEVPDSLSAAVVESDGSLLHGEGTETEWQFRVRLPDDAAASTFHEACRRRDVRFRIDRSYPFGRDAPAAGTGLTARQREALALAFERGYFDVPRGATLGEVAAELDVSSQAASELLRRGLATVVEPTLATDELELE